MSGAEDALTLFERWYEQEADQLYRFIWVRVQDTPLAEEVMATVCEEVITHINRYDPQRGSMRAWIYGIARNILRSTYRAAQRGPQQVTLERAENRPASTHARPVEAAAQRRDEIERVLRHLETLSEADREVIALRYGAGLTNPEIAEVTGMSLNYVAVRLHRAIKKLRDTLNLALLEAAHDL